METAGWGVHLATFVVCVWALLHRSKGNKRPINWPMLLVAIALFVVGSLDIALNLYHVLEAFVFYTGSGGPTAELDTISNWVNVLRSSNTFLQTLIADGALIYRCYVIYNRRWIVIALPILIWMADTAVSVVEIYYTSTIDMSTSLPDASKPQPFAKSYILLAFVQNVTTTGLIVYRIAKIHSASARYFSTTSRGSGGSGMALARVNRILVESALLYTIFVTLTLIVEFANSNGVYGVSSLMVQIAGVQFDLIIIRIGRGIAAEHVQTTATMDVSTHLQLRVRKETTVNRFQGSDTAACLDENFTQPDFEGSGVVKNASFGTDIEQQFNQ